MPVESPPMVQEDWPKVVASSVVPVVVISACGLLCLAFYNRLAAVVSRLRAFHRERLHEQAALERHSAAGTSDPAAAEAAERAARLLDVLEEQTDNVARRARLIRASLQCLLSTIGCLTVCSVLMGLSVVSHAFLVFGVGFFLAGMVLLLLAVGLAMAELRRALDPVELESRFIASLAADEERRAA